MIIDRPRPGVLEFRESQTEATVHVVLMAVVIGIWYVAVFASEGGSLSFRLVASLWPLLVVPALLSRLKVAVRGEHLILDKERRRIERNGDYLAHFLDVDRVETTRILGEDGPEHHRLSLVFDSGEELLIHSSTDGDEIVELAREIANMLYVKLTRKIGDRIFTLNTGVRRTV